MLVPLSAPLSVVGFLLFSSQTILSLEMSHVQ
jgi:hypothetical protein